MRRATLAALGITLVVAGCGSSAPPKTQTLPASGAPPHQRVPAQATVLTVTRGRPGQRPSVVVSTTQAELGKLATIAAMLDRLHPVPPGVINCPMIPAAPTVTFTFRARHGGRVLAQASTLANGPFACPGMQLAISGRKQPALIAGPRFIRQAGRILGITLLTQ